MSILTDKVAIITGGGTGIGKATAELFTNEGARLILLGRRKAPLEKASQETGAEYYQCDITNEKQVRNAVEEVVYFHGGIDILVNNAGIHTIEGPLTELEEKVIDEILGTNVKGTLLMSKHVLRKMKQQGYGSIINVASILGVIGSENVSAYTASKGAVIALTRAMAIEYAKYRIRVNCVSPSLVETDMMKEVLEGCPEFKERLLKAHPNERFVTPREVAQAILYLASDVSSFVNGQNLVIDAGRSIYDR
jgi:NAD(P)-dependent dehydrogenase (short-subunit alcohol dehydrogenase family)